MKIVAIVQARMGSTRLPGKTLMPLAGKPLLWHVLERAKKIKMIEEVVLATTINPLDDEIEKFSLDNNVSYMRGPEADVLERFILAGDKFKADGIVRINADVPLLAPDQVDLVVKHAIDNNLEACYVDVSTPTAVAGFEYATLDALKRVRAATSDIYPHEHVTVYLRTEPNFSKHEFVKPDSRYDLDSYQPAIDTQADYQFFSDLYDRFYEEGKIIELAEVVNYLRHK